MRYVRRSPRLYARYITRRAAEALHIYASCRAPGYLALTFSIFKFGSHI